MTNEQLNEWIATEIMGWQLEEHSSFGYLDSGTYKYIAYNNKSPRGIPVNQYRPTTNIAQALEALEKYATEFGIVYGKGGYCVNIYGVSIKCRATHKSLPLAICLALREAKESNDE